MSKFGENLKELMNDENLSTVILNRKIGISKTQLGKYLSGYYEPTLKNAIKICNYFDCSLDYLLGIDSDKNSFDKFTLPSYDKFIKRYFELIKENHTNHKQLSTSAKFNRNNLVYWQKNKTLPTLDILYKLALILNTKVEYLIGRSEEK